MFVEKKIEWDEKFNGMGDQYFLHPIQVHVSDTSLSHKQTAEFLDYD